MLLILQAAVFGPAFARAAAAHDVPGLWLLLRRTQWISTLVFAPLALGLLLAREPLAALFHLPPGALAPFLLILAAGQLVNALTGLPGILLNMAGGAAIELKALLATIVLASALSPVVGPIYGATGLACLFAASVAFKNLVSYLAAVKHLRQREE
jgi:O-antigen/teichoic acid export membrane protein